MKTFLTLAFLSLFCAFVAQPASAQEATETTVEDQIQAALNDGNVQLASDLASQAIAADPSLASQLINMIVANNPSNSTVLAESLAQNAPNEFSNSIAVLGTALSSVPGGTAIYNSVIANAATAAGGNNQNNAFANLPPAVITRLQQLNATINGQANGLETIVNEAQSGSPN